METGRDFYIMNMRVLCIMPTYGRIPFLGRAVASFLGQTHEDKELVIINDDPNVKLKCSSKGVHCINVDKRMLVGEKRNMGVILGDYDLYMPFDDDDIFMPNRITNHVNKHLANPDIGLYRNTLAYSVYGNDFISAAGTINGISFTKKAWFKCGGYQLKSNYGEDKHFEDSVLNRLVEEDPNERDYVYNFGGINYHLSNSKDPDLTGLARQQLKSMKLYGGTYNIIPDVEQFERFIELEKIHKETNAPVQVQHVGLGKIKIVK